MRSLWLTLAPLIAQIWSYHEAYALLTRSAVSQTARCRGQETPTWTATTTTPPINKPATICSIGNIFGGSKEGKLPSLPRDVKDAVSSCRASVQEALGNRISRMDVEFPVGTKFNVEKTKGGGRKQSRQGDDSQPTQADLQKSDRELARLFVEMFQPVGSDNIAVVFNDINTADRSKAIWKRDPTARAKILSMDRKRSSGGAKKKAAAKKRGFAAKLSAEMDDGKDVSGPFRLPEGIEVALFVAPGPKELIIVENICQEVGMGTLVVLLNARLSSITNFGSVEAEKLFLEEFESVFHLAAAPQDVAPNCLLYRPYPQNWVLARKPKVGQPKTIVAQEDRPTRDDCQTAFDTLEITDFERNVDNAIENVAGWFS